MLYITVMLSGIIMIGCGSSQQMVPLQTHLNLSDSLTQEINALKSQNSALKNRVSTLELGEQQQATRISDLQAMVTSLKEELAKIPPPRTKPAFADANAKYQYALQLFRERNYSESASTLQSLLDAGVAPPMEDNCHYWLGECAFGSKNYSNAIVHFQKVFAFEISEKKDESQIMIARSYGAMGNRVQAKIEYQKLIDTYPASPYLQRAKEQMTRY